MSNCVDGWRSREESKFLALLTRTQQKAAKITGVARRTFANSNGRHRKVSNRKCLNKFQNPNRSSSNESGSASSGNEKRENLHDNGFNQSNIPQRANFGRLSLSSNYTSDYEYVDSSEEHLNDNMNWESIEDSTKDYDWRLPKYVEALEQWLQDLEKHPHGPKKDTLGEYRLKVEFLRKVVTTLENEKLEVEAKYLMNAADLNEDYENKLPRRKTSLPSHRDSPPKGFHHNQTSVEGNVAKSFSVLPHGQASTGDVILKEIHQKMEGRQARKLRDELLNTDCEGHSRNPEFERLGDNRDLDELLQAHHTAQEQVAEEMLKLTRSLKEQTIVAGEIVRKDIHAMERSNQLAEANSAKLQV